MKPKIIRIDTTITAQGVLEMLEQAKLITVVKNETGLRSYVAERGTAKSVINKFIIADEKADDDLAEESRA
jgi:hypothetical protein